MMNRAFLSAGALVPLLVGASANFTSGATTTTTRRAAKACVVQLVSCPEIGCADEGKSPNDALANQIKRTRATGSSPVFLTTGDLDALQETAEKRVGTKEATLSAAQRQKLHGLRVNGKQVGEGDLVAAIGFIVGKPHANSKESVNCNLRDETNNDIHITIANHIGSDETDGFVVEMIPQDRPEEWSSDALEEVQRQKRQVLIVGQLFYDSQHAVNDDPANLSTNDPKRFTLFEIHPVNTFRVCNARSFRRCDPKKPAEWIDLEAFPVP